MLPTPVPEQFGASPLPAVAAVGLLTLLVALGLAVWVGLDAADHSDRPLAWALATLVGGVSPLAVGSVAVTLLYRRSREELGSIAPPSVRNESEIQRGEVLGEAVDRRRHAAQDRSRAGATDGGEITGSEPDGQTDHGDDAALGDAEAARCDAASGDDAGTASADDFGGFEMADPVESDEEESRPES